MQLKGISRKIIFNSFVLTPNLDCTIETVEKSIERASIEGTNINKFTGKDIEEAIEKADKIIKSCENNGIKIVTFLDSEYPEKLKSISDPPTILYYKGNINCLNELHSVAIIGTRKPTEHGMKIARNLGSSFGKRNYVVVSGLAVGCDTGGHEGCLDQNGKTVAVMAGGLDRIYPAQNKGLAQRILNSGGALLSEYPPYTKTFKNFFVERDRLQSGLSDGVIVVETAEKGGTLHTVQYALEYQRILACYSHPSKYLNEKQTFGNQKLIKEGKAMAVGNDDELAEFRNRMENREQLQCGRNIQSSIFDFLN